jgi:hypothetical protein
MRISHPLHRRRSGGLRRGYAGGMPIPAMAVHSQPLPLPDLLPTGSRGFAVLDLETTGTGQLSRGRAPAGVDDIDQSWGPHPQCRGARHR